MRAAPPVALVIRRAVWKAPAAPGRPVVNNTTAAAAQPPAPAQPRVQLVERLGMRLDVPALILAKRGADRPLDVALIHAPGGEVQVSAITGNGTITTVSTRLRGHSLVQARSGTINFHGSLDPGSHAVFRNANGAIGVTMPAGSPVLVDARTRSGSINSGFSSVHVALNSRGQAANGRVGRGLPAHLSIQTTGGSIDLNQGT